MEFGFLQTPLRGGTGSWMCRDRACIKGPGGVLSSNADAVSFELFAVENSKQ